MFRTKYKVERRRMYCVEGHFGVPVLSKAVVDVFKRQHGFIKGILPVRL